MKSPSLKDPIVVKGNIFTGNISKITQNPLDFYCNSRNTYGDYIKYKILPKVYVYGFYHPDAVQQILQRDNYKKPKIFYKATRILFGEGIFTSEGEEWLKQRRVLQPSFNRKKIELLVDTMIKGIEKAINKIENYPQETEINISEEMVSLTLNLLSTTLFSVDITEYTKSFADSLREGFKVVGYRMGTPIAMPLWVPTDTNKKFAVNKKTIYSLVEKIVSDRRNSKEDHHDLLAMLMNVKDENGNYVMTDEQLRDEMIGILVAGHDTTASALSWAFYLLAKNPDKKKKLQEEVDSVLSNRKINKDDLEKLPYTKMVFEEALRLYPPAWGFPREAQEDDDLNGFLVKKNLTIVLSPYVTHRHPEFWEKPLEFYPEHFEEEAVKKRHKFAFFPFGGGSRMCIGQHFAMLEAQLIIASLVQRFDFELFKDHEIELDTTFTLIAKNGIKFLFKKRT